MVCDVFKKNSLCYLKYNNMIEYTNKYNSSIVANAYASDSEPERGAVTVTRKKVERIGELNVVG